MGDQARMDVQKRKAISWRHRGIFDDGGEQDRGALRRA
jgi:hypothetical protein